MRSCPWTLCVFEPKAGRTSDISDVCKQVSGPCICNDTVPLQPCGQRNPKRCPSKACQAHGVIARGLHRLAEKRGEGQDLSSIDITGQRYNLDAPEFRSRPRHNGRWSPTWRGPASATGQSTTIECGGFAERFAQRAASATAFWAGSECRVEYAKWDTSGDADPDDADWNYFNGGGSLRSQVVSADPVPDGRYGRFR